MTDLPSRILWGPYNHQIRDWWIQSNLHFATAKRFGPVGSPLPYRPEQPQSFREQVDAFAPDMVLLLDPHLRWIGPELLHINCPLVVCGSIYPFSAEQWKLFDGLVPIEWQPNAELAAQLPVSAPLTDWTPATGVYRYAKPRIHPLLCLSDDVSPALWQALEVLAQPVLYMHNADAKDGHRICSQSQVVLIPPGQPAESIFEAWTAGAKLLLADEIAVHVRGLLREGVDFVRYRPETLAADWERARQLADSGPFCPGFTSPLQTALREIWPAVQARSQQRPRAGAGLMAAQAQLRGMWSIAPVQHEALPLLKTDFPWLQAALEPGTGPPSQAPSDPGTQLAAARYWLSAGEPEKARAAVMPLLSVSVPNTPFPIEVQTHFDTDHASQWRLAVLSIWLATRPEDLSPLLSETQPPRALKQALIAFLDLPQRPHRALATWLIQHWPADAQIRARALALLPPEAAQTAGAEACSLYARSISVREQRTELLSAWLSTLPPVPGERPLVVWEGPFSCYSSFSRVNVGLLKALAAAPSVDVLISDEGMPEISGLCTPFALPEVLRRPDILVSQEYPPRTTALPWGGKWVAIMPWEYGLVTQERPKLLRDDLDEAWVPSQFCVDAYRHSGVPADRLHVIPNGVDTDLYHPEGPVYELPTQKKCRFLYVGGTLFRKGFDLMLNAYLAAFGPEDDVCLVIKDYGALGQYSGDTVLKRLYKEIHNPHSAEIVLLLEDHLSDADLVSLYRACQVYLQAYRAEGFGMPILEAMACGLPVVIPDEGPAPEFCPPEASWRLPTTAHFLPREAEHMPGFSERWTALPSFYYEPHAPSLTALLRELAADPAICQAKGLAARQAALAYDWRHLGHPVSTRLLALQQQPLSRRERRQQAREAHAQHTQLSPQAALPLARRASELDPENGEYGLSRAACELQNGFHTASQESLQQGFAHGLTLERVFSNPVFKGYQQPLRVWKHPDCPLPLPRSHPQLRWVERPEEAAFCLSHLPLPEGPARQIAWLAHPHSQVWEGQPVDEVWTPERSWADTLLQAGLSPTQLFELPLALDFSRFQPVILPPYRQDPHFGILCITFWQNQHWQTLLQAVALLGKLPHPLTLTLIPLGASASQLQKDLACVPQRAGLTLRCQSLSSKPADLHALYSQHNCFVDTDPQASGQWHLLAQAMGLPCISAGQRRFLQRPFSELCLSQDPAELAWRLEERLTQPQAMLDALAIRQHIQPQHDRAHVEARGLERLGQLALLHALSQAGAQV
ncbi:MAG: glycosyltransferase family 4 protein [Candidatus Sericytochromatia bacterium]